MHPIYRGVTRQYGGGLGSMFKSAIRTVTPFIKPILKTGLESLKNEGMKQGMGLAKDIFLEHKNPNEVFISRGKQAMKSLGKSFLDNFGIKAKKNTRKHHSRSVQRRGNINKTLRNQKGLGKKRRKLSNVLEL